METSLEEPAEHATATTTLVLPYQRHDDGRRSQPQPSQPQRPAAHQPPVAERGFRRLTIVGMGLAGGLVPSPTALVVLLGAIGLGRTAFGVLLVLGYGIGMAATLILVGYLIAKAPTRLPGLTALARRPLIARLLAHAPVVTACLVLVVGLGLALRSLAPLV
jgi:ABC-type nickel/cobalt efflux system permease component RcnA